MNSYAQTILQLYDQLRRDGYSNAEMILIRNVYELSMSLFSGRFQPSGKTFISHGVGTASILASLRSSAQLVASGLIHNVYQNGDFRDGTRVISKAKRKYVRRAVGEEVEEYVARFATLRWNSQTISTIHDRVNELNPLDRNTVLIRLADHLEHLLDFNILYYNDTGRQRYTTNDHILAEIAEKMGFPVLSDEIKQSYIESALAEIPVKFIPKRSTSFVIPPKSYCKRPSVLLAEGFNHLRSAIKLRKVFSFWTSARAGKNKI